MSKHLITDRDVLSGAVRSPLVLGPDTLITPSARDRAVRLGWTIVEDGAVPAVHPARAAACPRCGAAGCDGGCPGCGGSGSARLDALADGRWRGRSEGGQMVSALPASGPGVMQRSTGAARVASDAGGRA
jgi:hypothetical protein